MKNEMWTVKSIRLLEKCRKKLECRYNEAFVEFRFVSSMESLDVLILLIIKRKGEPKTAFALIITPSSCCANSKNLIPRGEVSNFFADNTTENRALFTISQQ